MKQLLVAIGITILTSLFFFPFNTVWLPAVNTKMALAALAIPLFFIRGAQSRNSIPAYGMIGLSVSGAIVSLIGIFSVIINNTGDYTYASYFISMYVWLGGAYVVTRAMEAAYGKVTIRLVGNFLIAVCVVQCILAQIIHAVPAVANVVDGFMVSTGFMGKHESRLYGIGCALDVAGLRFCTVLLMATFFALTPVSKKYKTVERCMYIFAFLVIAIFGSMIARTTSLGVILCVVMCILFSMFSKYKNSQSNTWELSKTFIVFLLIVVPVLVFTYNVNPDFRENLRFGFEGFFALAEQGEWNVRSNDQLLSMVVWPDNLKTWIIGDGYFNEPQNDYYYVGPNYEFYMGTDVGYCRFVFYFGILGLAAFSIFFIASTMICSKNHPKYMLLFWMIMLMNFVGWLKVATDIFLVFALFLCISREDNDEYEKIYENPVSDTLDI